jgi:hypothetical protein
VRRPIEANKRRMACGGTALGIVAIDQLATAGTAAAKSTTTSPP